LIVITIIIIIIIQSEMPYTGRKWNF